MYKQFYRLQDNPFRLSPDPRYYLFSSNARGTSDQLIYGINQGVGFMMVTGEVGVGKTSFLRFFLKTLDQHQVKRVLLYNPTLASPEDLLKFILLDSGFARAIHPQASKPEMLLVLFNSLMVHYRRGRRFLLIVDEAQALSDSILEEIRLLSNLEADDEKLIQIILMGQPELKERISKPSLRQLNQRIAIRAELNPFNRDEVQWYINHRLSVGGTHATLFQSRAIKAIYRASKGIPRLINVIAERSLIAGYVSAQPQIGPREVKAALHDIARS